MAKVTDATLRPYGYAPGKFKRWCASCGFTCDDMAATAFKCKRCAINQARQVRRDVKENEE